MFRKFESCEPDDPRRCQAVSKNNQCIFKALEGSKYCPRHTNVPSERKESLRLYLANEFKNRIGYQADHPKLKSLTEEIAILRITLNTQLERCGKDENELLMRSPKIIEMTREIGKLVKSAQVIDERMGIVLDQNQAKEFIQDIANILSNYITDTGILQMISEDMLEAFESRTHKDQ